MTAPSTSTLGPPRALAAKRVLAVTVGLYPHLAVKHQRMKASTYVGTPPASGRRSWQQSQSLAQGFTARLHFLKDVRTCSEIHAQVSDEQASCF